MDSATIKDVRCPYCGEQAIFGSTKKIYKTKDYGKAYICANYPACDAYVGVHKHTKTPLGTLANKKLRKARNDVHKIFDPLWQAAPANVRYKKKTRLQAYQWLAKELNISLSECHIAMFDLDMCHRAIDLITGRRECLREKFI